jgi:hypothetical protein
MADVSTGHLRGLLIPDPRLTYADAYSSASVLTQQGPIPGVPVALNESEMVLEASGIDPQQLRAYAASGIDLISSSAPVTRSPWLDLSMRFSAGPSAD